MSLLHNPRRSHQDPERYRAKFEDTNAVLGPDVDFYQDTSKPVEKTSSKISIIGAGFGGIAASLMCKNKWKTEDFAVFDKHEEWGGTWWANTYPGCASDIPALWYSIFAELNSNWSTLRPPQYEMEEYILNVVKKYKLHEKSRLGVVVHEANWQEESSTWLLKGSNIKSGQMFEHTTQILLSCSGGLVYPNQLKAPGLDKFKGAYMHSALWDHSVPIKGKNVVVVGNGSSAAQVVPALIDECDAASVTQVFRSKHWISPPPPPFLHTIYRALSRFRIGLVLLRWFVAVFAEMRYPLFQGNGPLARILRALNQWSCKRYVRKYAPEYYDKIIPDFKLGCKRLIFDYKYIPSLRNPKIELNDTGIDHITEDTVYFKDGQKAKADVIVACTGYSIPKAFFNGVKLTGKNDINIQEIWKKEGVSAYKTHMVRDSPNFFFFAGPNSATGHSSVVSAIENAVAWVGKVAKPVVDGKYKSVTVSRAAYYQWFETTQKQLSTAVFGSPFGGCVSWYTDGDYNPTTYPFSQVHYFIKSRIFGTKDLTYEKADDKKTV
ncbi:hypothetical protein FT663_01196 [Candidozyma haemuli var. vulneris]|nr:hypothetical protein FT662_01231 [[Candida] haemuloni var. vulneris]KAF3994729.1 hypothetical protein FT663_01196 [[Candida] haemuloni var. vulneris]